MTKTMPPASVIASCTAALRRACCALAFLSALTPAPALAGEHHHHHHHDHAHDHGPHGHAQHAHVHGELSLDVAVEDRAIVIHLHSALDSVLGFERAPRTQEEARQVRALARRLRAADQLLRPDAAAGCTLGEVVLDSEVLDFDEAAADAAAAADTHAAHGPSHEAHSHTHADMSADIIFHCTQPGRAAFVDVRLFDAFERLHTVQVQMVTAQGQFRRTLRRGDSAQRLLLRQ